MIFIIRKKIIFVFLLFITTIASEAEEKYNRIEVLVNENIITKYDIIQRLKINSILSRFEINEENYNQLLSAVVDEMVVEKLKIKKIEEYNVNFDKEEFANHEEIFLSNNNYKKEDLKELFSINNINYSYLRDILEIDIKWQKLIYGLYLRVSSVTEQEISDLISKNPEIDKKTASDLLLQRQLDLKSKKLIKDLRDEATIEYK